MNYNDIAVGESSSKKSKMGFCVWDTMGWSDRNFRGGDFGYIIDGNIVSGTQLSEEVRNLRCDFVE